ncbi:hypothetical protein [Paracoccus luteus]|nr:hypothetical protein [Paracoccus luteus]
MSKKVAFALVLVGLVAACAQQPAPPAAVVVQPEPVFQGKFGAS